MRHLVARFCPSEFARRRTGRCRRSYARHLAHWPPPCGVPSPCASVRRCVEVTSGEEALALHHLAVLATGRQPPSTEITSPQCSCMWPTRALHDGSSPNRVAAERTALASARAFGVGWLRIVEWLVLTSDVEEAAAGGRRPCTRRALGRPSSRSRARARGVLSRSRPQHGRHVLRSGAYICSQGIGHELARCGAAIPRERPVTSRSAPSQAMRWAHQGPHGQQPRVRVAHRRRRAFAG